MGVFNEIFTVSFLLFSIPISVVDIYKRQIPNLFVFTGIVVLLWERVFIFDFNLFTPLTEMVVGGLTLQVVRMFTKGKLGMGDVKYGFYLALFTGIPLWFFSLWFASLMGIIFFILGFAAGKLKLNSKIPFAPFLTVGCLGAYILKNKLLLYSWNLKW